MTHPDAPRIAQDETPTKEQGGTVKISFRIVKHLLNLADDHAFELDKKIRMVDSKRDKLIHELSEEQKMLDDLITDRMKHSEVIQKLNHYLNVGDV
jgi:hypothetical protein